MASSGCRNGIWKKKPEEFHDFRGFAKNEENPKSTKLLLSWQITLTWCG
jgi:hypothetical protein